MSTNQPLQSATVVIASHRPEVAQGAVASLSPCPTIRFDGSGAPSCSWVWNQCIRLAPTETVVICNEKARPTPAHVEKTLSLLADGFGFVGLYRFGFFGLRKELIRRIGFFDEKFIGGWFEDNDFLLRMDEANIASYLSEEVPYLQLPSSWAHEGARSHFEAKWRMFEDRWLRLLPEGSPLYDLGPSRHVSFLPAEKSHWINVPARRERVHESQKVP